MVPSNFTESQRTEVSKVKWFTDRVSFVSSLSSFAYTEVFHSRRDFEIRSTQVQGCLGV